MLIETYFYNYVSIAEVIKFIFQGYYELLVIKPTRHKTYYITKQNIEGYYKTVLL